VKSERSLDVKQEFMCFTNLASVRCCAALKQCVGKRSSEKINDSWLVMVL
jgi:hypothetical protein